MSNEAAVAFLRAINDKPELKEQLRARKIEENQTRENQKSMLDIAAKAGYSFTVEELTAAARTLAAERMESGEISEEELEKIAGGNCGFSFKTLSDLPGCIPN